MRAVLIQAGGDGKRVGNEIPKQFIEVKGKPIIAYTLERFQANSLVDAIYITCLKTWREELISICKKHCISKLKGITDGGTSIFHSTRKCLMEMKCSDDSFVLIHEAVRPLITDEIITDSFRVAETRGNAVACYKSIDETGYIADGEVLNIHSANNLVTIHNPHTFKLAKLRWAYYADNEPIGCQGTAALMYSLGETLFYSKGSVNCFKITYEEDIHRFEALLQIDSKKEKNMDKKCDVCLPEGVFFGNCRDCRYADWNDTDSNGRVYCDGGYGGYNNPRDRNGCGYFVER